MSANSLPVSDDEHQHVYSLPDTRLIDMEEMITDDVTVLEVEFSTELAVEEIPQSSGVAVARADNPVALPGPLASLIEGAPIEAGAIAPTLFMGAFQVMRMDMPTSLPTMPGGLPALPGGLAGLIPGAGPEA